MRGVYRGLALAIAALVALQAAFIAYFISGISKWIQKDGGVLDASVFAEGSTVEVGGEAGIALHAISGTFVIPLVALILLIVSFFAKIPGGTKWALIVFGVVVLQYALAFFARLATLPALGALHGLNALILFGVAVTAAMRVRTGGSRRGARYRRRLPRLAGGPGGRGCGGPPLADRGADPGQRRDASPPWPSCGRPAWCRRTISVHDMGYPDHGGVAAPATSGHSGHGGPGTRSVETLIADPTPQSGRRRRPGRRQRHAHGRRAGGARLHSQRHLPRTDDHRRAGSAGRGAAAERVGSGRGGAALARDRRAERDGRRRRGDPGRRAGRR